MPEIVVFDINILLSAVLFRGPPHLAVRAAEQGLVAGVICPAILADFREKLLDKFGFDIEHADRAVELIRGFSKSVEVNGVVKGVCRDPDDDVILDCAVSGNAGLIVTGDKDLLTLDPFTDPT